MSNAVLEIFEKFRESGEHDAVDEWRRETVLNKYYYNIDLDEWSRDGGY